MIITSYLSETVALLNNEPDWTGGVSIEASTLTRKMRSLGGREARRGLGDSLRLAIEWTSILNTDELNELRDALQSLEDSAVLCPVWPLALAGSDWAGSLYSSGLEIGWIKDWSDFEIGAPVTTPSDWDFVAPLLRGVLDQSPLPDMFAPVVGQVRFNFVEDSEADYSLVPAVVTWSNGPALADATTPHLFPFDVDWQAKPSSGGAEFEIERTRLGPSRTRASSYYTQVAERPQTAALLLTSAEEIAEFLRWLYDVNFSVAAHYIPTAPLVTRITATAAAGTASITLTDAADIGTNRFLMLSNGSNEEIVKVTAIVGNVCTLSANLAHTWTASNTVVNLAMLARHVGDSVTLTFRTPTVADTKIGWREVPGEYVVASGETRGTTLGALTTKAWLYLITLDWNGATEVHRITSFERELTASAQTWTPRGIEHSALRHTSALDRDEITLKARWWDGCPFRKFLPHALDCKVTIAIYECDVAGAVGSNVTQWFGGEITGMPAVDGPMLTLSAAGMNALFDRPALKYLLQPGCNDELFGTWCGLSRADWIIGATVHAVSSKVVTLKTFTFPAGTPSGFGFAHWFALGYLERTISGIIYRHTVFDSAAIDGSSRIAVTLGSVASPAIAVNDTLSIVPGCDNRPETCRAYNVTTNPTGKFNNYARFAGMPFIPDKAPGFTPLKKSDSTAGKK